MKKHLDVLLLQVHLIMYKKYRQLYFLSTFLLSSIDTFNSYNIREIVYRDQQNIFSSFSFLNANTINAVNVVCKKSFANLLKNYKNKFFKIEKKIFTKINNLNRSTQLLNNIMQGCYTSLFHLSASFVIFFTAKIG